MKKLNVGMVLAMSLLGATSAFASVTDMAGTWVGKGALFSIEGKALSDYAIEIVNTAVGEHEIDSAVTVVLPDGSTQKFSQTMKDSDQGFTLSSDYAKGGGYCLGEGLCVAYVDAGNGHAFAIDIVLDGPAKIASSAPNFRTEKPFAFTVRNTSNSIKILIHRSS